MITRSDIDTQIGSTKIMGFYRKLFWNKRYRGRSGSRVEATVWTASLSVLFAVLIASSGCSTQPPVPKHKRGACGTGGSLSSRLRDEWS
jgi:hypothetical protein